MQLPTTNTSRQTWGRYVSCFTFIRPSGDKYSNAAFHPFLISSGCYWMNLSHTNLMAYKCGLGLIGFISELLFILTSITEATTCRLCEAAPKPSSLSYGSAQILGNWITRVYVYNLL